MGKILRFETRTARERRLGIEQIMAEFPDMLTNDEVEELITSVEESAKAAHQQAEKARDSLSKPPADAKEGGDPRVDPT